MARGDKGDKRDRLPTEEAEPTIEFSDNFERIPYENVKPGDLIHVWSVDKKTIWMKGRIHSPTKRREKGGMNKPDAIFLHNEQIGGAHELPKKWCDDKLVILFRHKYQ